MIPGLYVHIPFCASRCSYCGFYSTTLGAEWKARYVAALCHELMLRGGNRAWQTVYLGGGTPSQLPPELLEQLFDAINDNGNTHPSSPLPWGRAGDGIEVTMEVNPDDVNETLAATLRRLPVNRVSMGIQTFDDNRLRRLHRRHTASQARKAVELLHDAGIDNVSIDLMLGFPDQTLDEWKDDVEKALLLDVQHVSAYSLAIEEGTPLYREMKKNKTEPIDEEVWRSMYEWLMERMDKAGFEHYEISNFARPGFRSRHNSIYWNGTPYVGIGAAAHSYDGEKRSWNMTNVKAYIDAIEHDSLPTEIELLDETTRYNDLITTALRTSDGIDLQRIDATWRKRLLANAADHLRRGLLHIDNNHIHLTKEGLFVSDSVMSDLIEI